MNDADWLRRRVRQKMRDILPAPLRKLLARLVGKAK
jgi:hypothetical protein